ncbi:MAG: two-component regulator propeller domain-containing protein [Gemmatimonadaceae bacterium]
MTPSLRHETADGRPVRAHPSPTTSSCLGAALALAILATAATSAPAQTLNFRQYTGADGLPQSQVLAIHQDRHGYIWFATYGGLSRFDGSEIRTYTKEDGLASNSVFDIVEDDAGRLYMATDGGLCIRDRGRFTCRGQADGLVSDVTRNVALDRSGGIWVGTLRGLSHVSGNVVRNYTSADGLPADRVIRVVADSAGRVWVATPNGLVRHDGERLVSDPADPLSSAGVQFIAPAGPGILIGADGRLFLRDGDVTTSVAEGRIPAGTAFHDGVVGSDGTIWAATRDGALSIHDGNVEHITRATGLPSEFVNRVMIDRESNVWFGTDNGASKHVPGPFRTYTVESGLPAAFMLGIALDEKGGLWFGTRGGVAVWKAGAFTTLPLPNVHDRGIYALAREPRGGMLIGTRRGLVWYRDGHTTAYGEAEGIPGESVTTMLEDGRGGVIIGTGRGLARWKDGRITRLGAPEISQSGIMSLARDSRGRIWLGRVSGGVAILDGDSVRVIGADQGGSDQTIWDMREDAAGTMWVGTNGDGVLRISGDSVRRMTTRDGLASNFIWQVLVDSRGDTWLFGNAGLDRLSGRRLTHYGRGSGLIQLEGTAAAAFEDPAGNLWFGAGDDVVRYTPGLDVASALVPPIAIEEATLAGDSLSLATPGRAVKLGRGALRIRFSSATFRDEAAVRYSYRLVGSSEGWSAPVSDRSITFARLSPGQYRFEVVAVNGALRSVAPATLAFTVTPEFWQSWWFRLLAVLALTGGAALLPMLRARSLERERRRLERLVAAHTAELAEKNLRLERSNGDLEYFAYIASHDLQEPLRKIQAFSDRVARQYAVQLDDQGRDYLSRMSGAAARMQLLIDALLGLSRVSSRKMTSEPVDLAPLVREVVGDLEVRIQSTGGRVELGDLPRTSGDAVQLRQLFQNLIGNALKFHRDGELPVVRVSAARGNDGMLEIRVQDNGIGFEAKDAERIFLPFQRLHGRSQYEGTGIGLTICQKIVERHGGTIRAESSPGVGTSFVFTLPTHDQIGVLNAA